MKKTVILLIVIAIICSLCSCTYIRKNVTINEKNATLTLKTTDSATSITFDGEEYNVFAADLKGLYLYIVPGELVTYYWSQLGPAGLYMTNNPDFGIAFRMELVIAGLLDNPFKIPNYYLSENSNIPNIETIAVSDIVYVTNMGMIQDVVYTEWSNVDDLISSSWTKKIDRNLWNSESDTVLLGDIIDFCEPIVIDDEYEMMGEMVFTPIDYESFFCGPFDLIEINGEYYVRFSFNTNDLNAYKINDNYQFVFGE